MHWEGGVSEVGVSLSEVKRGVSLVGWAVVLVGY